MLILNPFLIEHALGIIAEESRFTRISNNTQSLGNDSALIQDFVFSLKNT